MVTIVVMTVWIRRVQGSEKVKDQDVDEAHGKNEEVSVCLLSRTVIYTRNRQLV